MQERERVRPPDQSPTATPPSDGASSALESARTRANRVDAILDDVLSGDSERFLDGFRQASAE
jgi:hypothetical protein